MIKIVKDGIVLDFVRETLNISHENNALSADFKGNHTTFPFLIIENDKAKKALGSSDITSINKKRTIEVDVFFGSKKYKGHLQVLSYIRGFRKCNLKFWSDLVIVTSLKIKDFMPVFSVIPGEQNPEPYSEESEHYIDGYGQWKDYPIPFINSDYPDVKWNFPVINNFLEPNQNGYNYNLSEYLINNAIINGAGVVVVNNRNNPAPLVYLLTPIEFVLDSIGFKMEGSFPENPFIKRILLLSHNSQKCITTAKAPVTNLTWDGLSWQTETPLVSYKEVTHTIQYEGTYYIEVRCWDVPPYTMTAGGVFSPMRVYLNNEWLTDEIYESHLEEYLLIQKLKIEVDSGMVGQQLKVRWRSASAIQRIPQHTINLYLAQGEEISLPHPTVELSRYVPDWTFGDYLNQIKKLFNLIITPDDVRKRLRIDFIENPSESEITEILKSSHLINEYDIAVTDGFRLGYENDIDENLLITKDGVQENGVSVSEFITPVQNKFKHIPYIMGSFVDEETKDKPGFGLVIYDSATKPATLDSYDGFTLKITGSGGIYESFHKVFLKSRLNSSRVAVKGIFTEIELKKIMEADNLYMNNQRWRLVSFKGTETHHKKNEVTLLLESITF